MNQKTNLKSQIGFGTLNMRDEKVLAECIKVINDEANYDFIDCAWRYGNEAAIGIALKRLETADSNFKFKLKLQSKVWPGQYKGGVNKALKLSLLKLGSLNEIYSYMLHRPNYDVASTISAWKQLVDCKRARLVKYIGVSNFDKDLIEKLYEISNYYPEFNQIELSVNNMRYDRIDYCHKKNITIQASSPLGQINENLKNPLLIKIANKYKATVPQILLAFLMCQNIIPIVRSTNYDHIIENAKAKDIFLSKEDIDELKTLNTYTNKFPETIDIDLNEISRLQEIERIKKSTKK